MKVKELAAELDALDPEADVVLRIAEPEDGDSYPRADDVIGAYAAIADGSGVQVEFGRVVLVGDLLDE